MPTRPTGEADLEAIERAYRKARIEAAQETGLEEGQFPQQCPDAWDDIVGRDFSP